MWPAGWFGSITTIAAGALAVVSPAGPVGVDVEPVASTSWLSSGPSAAFGTREQGEMGKCPALAIHLFTVKEAMFKAVPYPAQSGLLLRHIRPLACAGQGVSRSWVAHLADIVILAKSVVLGDHACSVAYHDNGTLGGGHAGS